MKKMLVAFVFVLTSCCVSNAQTTTTNSDNKKWEKRIEEMKKGVDDARFLLHSKQFYPDWESFEDSDSDFYYYRPKTIKQKGNLAEIWIKQLPKFDRLEAMKDAKVPYHQKYDYSIMLEVVDCKDKRTKLLHITNYTDKGHIVFSADANGLSEWVRIVPDSVGENIMNIACKKK